MVQIIATTEINPLYRHNSGFDLLLQIESVTDFNRNGCIFGPLSSVKRQQWLSAFNSALFIERLAAIVVEVRNLPVLVDAALLLETAADVEVIVHEFDADASKVVAEGRHVLQTDRTVVVGVVYIEAKLQNLVRLGKDQF